MSRNSSALALGLAGLAGLVAACDPEPAAWSIPGAVDCHQESLPGDYLRQSGGLFTVNEMLASGVGTGGGSPETDGMFGGSFSFWKELVETVPFDHPGNIVCQSLLFESETQAVAFVESLEATPASLSRATISWPSNDGLEVREATDELDASAREAGARAFVAEGTHYGEAMLLVLLFEPAELYVLGVHAGGPGQDLSVEQLSPALRALRAEAIAASD